MDPFQPEQWHDFFLATAGAAASLTGLLFVALSLHMRYIATQRVYRDMARGSLIGLVMGLALSLVVLVRQPITWLGIEFIASGVIYVAGVGAQQLVSLRAEHWQIATASLIRSLVAYGLALLGLLTGLGFLAGVGPGLYVTAFIVVAIVLWSLANAWVLVVGVADEEMAAEQKVP